MFLSNSATTATQRKSWDNDQEFIAGGDHWLLYASILFAEANNSAFNCFSMVNRVTKSVCSSKLFTNSLLLIINLYMPQCIISAFQRKILQVSAHSSCMQSMYVVEWQLITYKHMAWDLLCCNNVTDWCQHKLDCMFDTDHGIWSIAGVTTWMY